MTAVVGSGGGGDIIAMRMRAGARDVDSAAGRGKKSGFGAAI